MAKAEKFPLDQAWKNWVDCLKGNDTNSIFQQISLMIWDTAIFHIIVKSRQIQIEKNPNAPEVNGSLHSFIDRNYFQSQVAFIRRLTDKSYGLTGKRGVYSIYALINDIAGYKNELTREKYFSLRNLTYDYNEIREKEREFIRKQPFGKGFFVPPEFDWETIAEAHQTFDRLCQTRLDDRKPSDVIDQRVLLRLQEKLEKCREITNYVDKFVAHSATPESRASENVTATEITFRHLWEAHRIVFEVAEFISVILFSEGHMALAIENPSFFQYWETPLFGKGDYNLVRDTLEDYRKETEQWNQNGIADTWQWIES